jgi:SPP1 family predicted phage head-tail adaptor
VNLAGRASNPGELRTRITIQRRSAAVDAGGFQAVTWTTVASVWARWSNAHGSEVWAAQTAQAVAPATVTMRYRADVDASCALLKGTERFEIVSLDDIQERHEYIELKVQKARPG